MAEETVVREPLTGDMISVGEKLTRRLDGTDLEVVGSFWFYSSENNQWRLVIVSPQVDSEGPKQVYGQVNSALLKEPSEAGRLSLQSITVLSPNDTLVRLLKVAVRTGKGMFGIRFFRNVINNVFIEDAFIYRLV